MTKDDSLHVKGLAILMMLWYHLFDQPDYMSLYSDIHIANNNIAYYIARCCNPVYIFLIVSGYGLYRRYLNGGKTHYAKIVKLYLKYVVIISFFTLIGFLCGFEGFNSLGRYIRNVTLINTDYLVVYWFLLPYLLIYLCNYFILKVFDKHPWISLALSAFSFFSVSYAISRYGENIWNNPALDNVLHSIYLVFPFLIGSFIAKKDVFDRLVYLRQVFLCKFRKSSECLSKTSIEGRLWYSGILGLIMLVSLLRMQTSSYAANIFYEPTLVILFVLLPKHIVTKRIFAYFGRITANLWFVHGWLCYVFFREEIYSLSYPILIYSTFVFVSLVISIFFDFVFMYIKLK